MLAVVMSGLIDCGVSLYKHPSLVAAAREGALAAARTEPVTAHPGDEIRAAAVNAACASINRAGPNSGRVQVGVRATQIALSGGLFAEAVEVRVVRDNNLHFDMSKVLLASHGASSTFRIVSQIPPTPAVSVTACP